MYLLLLCGVASACASMFFKHKLPTVIMALAAFAWYFEAWKDGFVPFTIFSIGIFIVILEVYLPHTGFAGVIGSFVVGMVLFSQTQDWQMTWLLLFGMWLVGVAMLFIFNKVGFSLQANEALILDTQIRSRARDIQQEGGPSHSLVGQVGHAVSDLKPMGKVELVGQVYEARSALGFISQGTSVEVQDVSQGTLVVKKEEIR